MAPTLNLSIAFTSERSIQDEISRSSEADVVTILLSYCLMFAYIAVGLGQFKSVSRILVSIRSEQIEAVSYYIIIGFSN